jgi:hypothetical protein
MQKPLSGSQPAFQLPSNIVFVADRLIPGGILLFHIFFFLYFPFSRTYLYTRIIWLLHR